MKVQDLVLSWYSWLSKKRHVCLDRGFFPSIGFFFIHCMSKPKGGLMAESLGIYKALNLHLNFYSFSLHVSFSILLPVTLSNNGKNTKSKLFQFKETQTQIITEWSIIMKSSYHSFI